MRFLRKGAVVAERVEVALQKRLYASSTASTMIGRAASVVYARQYQRCSAQSRAELMRDLTDDVDLVGIPWFHDAARSPNPPTARRPTERPRQNCQFISVLSDAATGVQMFRESVVSPVEVVDDGQ